MNKPSVKTLREVFGDKAKQARRVLEMTRAAMLDTQEGVEIAARFFGRVDTEHLRMLILCRVGFFECGVESIGSSAGEYADYLNAGDTYAPTVIYWRGRYRVQSLGDFVETMERQGVRFN
ncbi:MAG TPA: hypothetical protein VFM46_01500 [Pseudomonadales bacterium]|nr:hypothetical protein [Pseudomonadales bacterium]